MTPEEYEKEMQDLIGGQASFDLFGVGLNAYADNVVDDVKTVYKDFLELTPAYNIYSYLKQQSELNTISNGHGGGGHYRYTSDDNSTAVINYEYDIYGKNRVVYSNGTWEIVECRLLTTDVVSDGSKTGVIKYTRTNQNYSSTSFAFDISVYNVTQVFNSSSGFYFRFRGINTYIQGCTQSFMTNYLIGDHLVEFVGSSTNNINQINYNSTKSYTQELFCWSSRGSTYPNKFTLCTSASNDYEFSQSLDNYYNNNGYWRLPNLYYNNNAGDTINQTNVNNYKQYGYYYNTETNTIDFDPDIYLAYFDTNIKPLIQGEFNSVFSKFPEISAKFGDLEIEYTNLVDIINNINSTTTTTTITGTYPVVTGDINVNVTVDVTLPEEFYRKYPSLTTEPAFIAENPNVDFAFDEPLPLEILETSGDILSMAIDIITDAGLMPVYIMCISLGLIALFLL